MLPYLLLLMLPLPLAGWSTLGCKVPPAAAAADLTSSPWEEGGSMKGGGASTVRNLVEPPFAGMLFSKQGETVGIPGGGVSDREVECPCA